MKLESWFSTYTIYICSVTCIINIYTFSFFKKICIDWAILFWQLYWEIVFLFASFYWARTILCFFSKNFLFYSGNCHCCLWIFLFSCWRQISYSHSFYWVCYQLSWKCMSYPFFNSKEKLCGWGGKSLFFILLSIFLVCYNKLL